MLDKSIVRYTVRKEKNLQSIRKLALLLTEPLPTFYNTLHSHPSLQDGEALKQLYVLKMIGLKASGRKCVQQTFQLRFAEFPLES